MNLRLFGKNALIYAVGTICLRLAAFLLIPVYTRSLSVSDYGLLAALLITIQVMATVMDLGMRKGFLRFAAEYQEHHRTGELLGSSTFIIIAGGVLVAGSSLLLLLPFFRGVFHTEEAATLVMLACGAALSQALYHHITSFYRARNLGLRYMVASLAALLLLIASNLVALFILRLGVRGALFAQIITYGGLWLLVSASVFRQTGLDISTALTKKLFVFGFPLVFALSGDLITDSSAIYLLSYFADLEHVAIYSLGQKMAMIASMVLILPFQLAYEPFLYAHIDQPGIQSTIARLFTYLMLAFAFVALAIAFAARDLLAVIATADYASAYLVIFLLLPGVAFRGVYNIGESLLHIKNKTQVTGITVTLATLLSVGLNYVLISQWGMYGAMLVFNVTMISTAVLIMALGIKAFPIRLETARLGVVAVLFVAFMAATYLLRNTNAYLFYGVVPVIGIGSLFLLCATGFLHDHERAAIRGLLYRT